MWGFLHRGANCHISVKCTCENEKIMLLVSKILEQLGVVKIVYIFWKLIIRWQEVLTHLFIDISLCTCSL